MNDELNEQKKDTEALARQHESDPDFDRDPVIEAYKKDVDRTLLRENLKLTVEERFVKFESFWEFAEHLRAAGRRSRQTRSGHGAELPRDPASPRSE